jgi:acetyl-CoA carboxylase carboxyl transferase subunit alpha
MAEALKCTAPDLLGFGVIDEIVAEPAGGAHRDPATAIRNLGGVLKKHLEPLLQMTGEQVVEDRYRRFRGVGAFAEAQAN